MTGPTIVVEATALLDAFPCPALLFDHDTAIRWNTQAALLLGYADPSIGVPGANEPPPPDLAPGVRAALAAEGTWIEYATPDDRAATLDLELSAARVIVQDRALVLVVVHDVSRRRRADAAIRASEERFRALYDDNPSMYFTVDGKGRVLSVNNFGAEQLGYRPNDLIGRPVLDVFHPDDRESLEDQLAQCIRAPGIVASWECRKVRRDGSILWVREDARTVHDGDRSIVLIVCEDITARKAIEEKLREARDELERRVDERTRDLMAEHDRLLEEIGRRVGAEARLGHERDLLHVLLDNLSEHIYFKDIEGRFVRVTRSLARFFGLDDPSEATGKTDFDFYPHQAAAEYRADEVEVLRTGQRMTKIEACRHSSGEQRFFLTTKTPVVDRTGAISGIFGISRDVTESRLAEQRLRSIIDGTPEAMIIVDRSGAIVQGTSRAQQLFGYGENELSGHRFENLIGKTDRSRLRTVLRRVEDPSRVARVMTVGLLGRRKEGALFPIEASLSTIETEDGRFVAASIRDVTERRNVEKRINDSVEHEQRRIGQEVHDTLGQQVTGMLMLAASLQRRLAARGAPEMDLVESLVSNIEEAQTQVRDISRGLIPVEVDANGLMSALSGLSDWTHKVHEIECTFECDAPVPIEDTLTATHLYRIAQEAIRNAVKHAEASNIVTSLRDVDGTVTLTVRDDGKGLMVDPESAQGMGLRIMRYRAGLIGATLDIDSRPGEGTLLVCSLPAAGD
jgi:two-component system CheB/CheR fusion protein